MHCDFFTKSDLLRNNYQRPLLVANETTVELCYWSTTVIHIPSPVVSACRINGRDVAFQLGTMRFALSPHANVKRLQFLLVSVRNAVIIGIEFHLCRIFPDDVCSLYIPDEFGENLVLVEGLQDPDPHTLLWVL